MESLKRLVASSVCALVQSMPSASVRDYLLRHFLFFMCPYLVCVVCFYCCFNGTAETLDSITAESRLWFMLLVHGIGVWCVHVCIARLFASVWRAGPFLTAAVGRCFLCGCAWLSVDRRLRPRLNRRPGVVDVWICAVFCLYCWLGCRRSGPRTDDSYNSKSHSRRGIDSLPRSTTAG